MVLLGVSGKVEWFYLGFQVKPAGFTWGLKKSRVVLLGVSSKVEWFYLGSQVKPYDINWGFGVSKQKLHTQKF